jgi:N-methylhydantoinase B
LVENVPSGTVLFQQSGGGGGYGNPYLRSPEQVVQEVKNGVISVERAKQDYGVTVDSDTLELDLAETEKIRKKIK